MRIRILQLKKTAFAALFVMLLIVVGVTKGFAQTFTVGNLNYSVNEDGVSVTVTGHVDGQNATGELVIPESVELYGTTYPVTTIGDNAFYYCSGFTGNLIIPNSVTTIGNSAFNNCSGFTGSLTLSNSVTAIGAFAFYGTGFTTVNFNATNCAQIGTEGYDDNWNWVWFSPFYNCSITTLNIGENVQSIPYRAFSGISSLTGDLTIPETVTIIGDRAFENTGFSSVNFNATNCTYMGSNNDLVFANCNNLTTLNIGENVEVIPSYAFKGCSGLNGLLVIPEMVTTIGDRAFENTGFSSVNFNATNCTYMGSNNDLVFANCNNLTTLNIGENVEVIPSYAFKGCSGLTGSLVIPESVSYIRGRAFENTGFTTVNFNATNCVQMGGEGYDDNGNWVWFSPFYNCSITTLNIGENVQSIPYRAFSGISSLTGELTVPESIAYIGDRVFESTGFTTVNFNATNCNYMGSYYDPVFADCNNLTTLNLGENVEMIPSYAFYNCGGFTGSINLPNVLTTIGEGAFQNCTGFTGSLVIPDNVTVIGQHAFRECSGLDGTLAIGNSVTEIGSNAFYHCYGLSGELTIPNSVQTIGIGVFIDCAFTGTLTIGAGVTSINNAAFRRLNINEVHWNAVNCTFAGDNYWEAAIFAECNALTTLVFDGAVETIPDGTFFGLNGLLGELHIPNSVTTIGYESFYGCSGFTGSLQIPNSVTSIGSYAFYDCTGIEGDLTIGTSVEVIGEGAFSSIGITTLNYNAVNCQFGYFYVSYNDYWSGEYSAVSNCPNLTTLNIGEGVESLSNRAFRDLATLTGVLTLPNSLTTIGDQAFYNCYGLEGIEMGNGVETIGTEAFRNCGGLRGELTLPETLQSVGNYAFASCDELTTINYNAVNCTTMGNAQQPVFYDCASVAHINIGENVESIPNYAFKRCSTVVNMTVAATVPPTIGSSTFGTVSRSIPVTVQCSATPAFQAAQYWSEFTNYAENFNYVLQVAASDPTKGTVVVSKEASCDDPTAMVTAYPELGYAFTGWSENGTMVSQANPYSFLMESSRSLQAEFAPGVSYSVAVTLNPAVAGSVTGMGNYNDGSAVSLIATANPGYAFVNWTENGTVVSSDETYTFTIHENHNFVANFTPYAYHWDVNIHQYPNNMTAIGIIQIEGVEQATPTLEIGAFCGDECRGRQLLTYYPQVNRYLVFLMLHGNDNDELRFKLYDHGLAEELELSCTSMVTFVTNGRLGTPANPYVFNFINSQQTEMSEGWTWYSTYIEQSDIEGLQMMTEGLGENGVMIKSQTGFIANSGGEWMGNLDAITNESMYMVNTTAAGMLEMVGNSAIASQHPITLNQGWNWIGYPLATANDVNVALSGLDAHDNDMLKSQEAFTTYYDGFGWMGSLNTITPGMGLMYESNNSGSVSFTYTEGRSGVLKRNVTAENNHWIPNMHKYTNNMNVMAVVELDDVELRDGRYELAVFAGEECRGSVRLMYVEPVDRYVAFLTISGHETTDLRFALFDSDEAVEYGNAKEHLVFESDVVVGNTKDMFTVHFNSQSQSYDFDQVAVYPNPADCGQNFRIAMPVGYEQNVRVEIINELGAVVSVVRSNALPMELKAPAIPGVYTLKIVAEGHDVSIRKLVVK